MPPMIYSLIVLSFVFESQMVLASSALVLPRIHKDAGVELCVYKGSVRVLSLEIRLVHSLTECPCLHENIFSMEVLIRRLREVILIQSCRILADLVLNHSIVEVVGCATICPEIISNQIFRSLRANCQTTILEIIILVLCVTLTENLRLGAEILLCILREVINCSLIPMKSAQVLIIIRVLVIIK